MTNSHNAALAFVCWLASLPVLALPAVAITFSPGEQLSLPISNTNPNMVVVPGDRITSISSATGMLTDKRNTQHGAVFFSSLSDKPFTLFVETELGQLLSINAAPVKGPGRTYRLFAKSPAPRPKAKSWETGQPYEAMLASLNRAVLQGAAPEGYGPAPVDNERPLAFAGLQATPESAWVGDTLHVVCYRLHNPLSVPVDLREQDAWYPGTRAVMFYPKYNRLLAGASTTLYVTRTLERTDGQH